MATAAPEIPSLARDRAFENLYNRYVKDVYHYSLALLRNPADAEDVTQTTFMNAYRAFKRGEHIEKPQNWLIKIAHNVARSRYARASRRVREVPLDDHVEQLALPEEGKIDVEAVLDALARLPLNQRAAIVMRELEGRTYAEIADTLGVSVPAVETLIFRARRSLRLKASAIRVLSVIPVPPQLAQFFEAGGTAMVGGGAVIGGGFLLKAAVAIVAGVVATGVGGDHSGPVAAAADAAGPAVQGLWTVGSEKQVGTLRIVAPVARSGRLGRVRTWRTASLGGAVTTARRAVLPAEDTRDAAPTEATHDGSTSAAPSTTSSATGTAAPKPGVLPASPTDTVSSAVPAPLPQVTVPTLPPIQTPPLPPPPQLPPAPPLP